MPGNSPKSARSGTRVLSGPEYEQFRRGQAQKRIAIQDYREAGSEPARPNPATPLERRVLSGQEAIPIPEMYVQDPELRQSLLDADMRRRQRDIVARDTAGMSAAQMAAQRAIKANLAAQEENLNLRREITPLDTIISKYKENYPLTSEELQLLIQSGIFQSL